VILAVLGPGDVVGDVSLYDGVDHSSSVVTLEDARVLRLDAESFRGMLDEWSSVRSGSIELLCQRLRLADGRLEMVAALDVEGRVARVLLMLAREHGEQKPGGGTRILVPLSQSDLAAMTGASRVRVNQVLSKFKRNGWVTLGGDRRTSVRDAEALEARCR
jgi:CRP-like cAMP-binding protein